MIDYRRDNPVAADLACCAESVLVVRSPGIVHHLVSKFWADHFHLATARFVVELIVAEMRRFTRAFAEFMADPARAEHRALLGLTAT